VRIAIFTSTYHPTRNGVANCVAAYRRGLQRRGHEVFVFAPAPSDYDVSQDPSDVIRFPALSMPGEWDYDIAVPVSRPVMDALRDQPFDLVHTQHPVWVGVWGQWYARWSGLPVVTTAHTEYELYSRVVPLPAQLVEAYLTSRVVTYYNHCHIVTTPVASAQRRLRKQGVVTPIEIVPNPIDLAQLPTPDPARVRAQHGLAPDCFVMGYIGRLAPEKSLETVLEAAAIVMNQLQRPARFLMVGGGSEMHALQACAQRLGIEDRTLFVGPVEHTEVIHYQAALDAFMTASMSETQPLAYTEAMAAGTPVVALKAPGAEDMIAHEHNGLLSGPREGPAGLAAQVMRLATEPALVASIAATGREHVRGYDVEVVVDRLLEVYERARQLHEAEVAKGRKAEGKKRKAKK
jgi:1,2-diacylglycerol 3-alpha-glucosyltransferase